MICNGLKDMNVTIFPCNDGLSDNTIKLPIILVTSILLFESQIQILKSSVKACLNKPLCFEELLKHVMCSIKNSVYENMTLQVE